MHGITPQFLDIVLDLSDILDYSKHTGNLERCGKDSRNTYCNKPWFLSGIQRRCKLLQSHSVGDNERTRMKHWRNCTARKKPKYSEEKSVPGPLYTPEIPHGQINLTQVKREARSPVGIYVSLTFSRTTTADVYAEY